MILHYCNDRYVNVHLMSETEDEEEIAGDGKSDFDDAG